MSVRSIVIDGDTAIVTVCSSCGRSTRRRSVVLPEGLTLEEKLDKLQKLYPRADVRSVIQGA